MSLTRLAVAWVLVALWYGASEWIEARLGWAGAPAPGPRPGVIAGETVLLTLFAALWFGSLGHGGWWLLFLILGVLTEGPVRLRHRRGVTADGGRPWLGAAAAIVRCVIAGGLLSWRLS
jgi:hypothetical protein